MRHPFLLRGLEIPIPPYLRGVLEFYGIQLHNLTPGSILHISGFVALCELFLGIEAHFELWRKFFLSCSIPPRRLYFRGGQCRSMAYSRIRLPRRDSEERIRRMVSGMVLYR